MNNLQIVSVIAILKNKEGKFLLVQRAKNDDIFPMKWQNLGGKVEEGETLEQAFFREIEEEVGIKLNKKITPKFVQSYSWKKDEQSPYRLGIIFMTELSNDVIISLSEELNAHGWFSYKEAETLDTIGVDSPTGTLGQLRKAQ